MHIHPSRQKKPRMLCRRRSWSRWFGGRLYGCEQNIQNQGAVVLMFRCLDMSINIGYIVHFSPCVFSFHSFDPANALNSDDRQPQMTWRGDVGVEYGMFFFWGTGGGHQLFRYHLQCRMTFIDSPCWLQTPWIFMVPWCSMPALDKHLTRWLVISQREGWLDWLANT